MQETRQHRAYDKGRYLTLTGNILDGKAKITKWDGKKLYDLLFPDEGKKLYQKKSNHTEDDSAVLQRIFSAKNGNSIKRLWGGDIAEYPSHSEADMALCSHLWFWTGNRSEVDRLFRLSELYRPKWDQKHYSNGRTYGEGVLDSTCNGEARTGHTQTIQTLAALSEIEYDQVRKLAAKDMGCRTSTLDALVKKAQCDRTEDDDGLAIDDPWPEPVSFHELLDQIRDTVMRYVSCARSARTMVTLWVAFTWFLEYVHVAPLLLIVSPEKRCGKSTLLQLIGRLVRRPLIASNITSAALFRSIEAWSPTLLIDEADTFLSINDELRGILNAGHTRDSAYVIRVVGDNHELKKFCVWGPKAISGIGRLYGTLEDRSLIVQLRRKLKSEKVDRLRHAAVQDFEILRRKLARAVQDLGAVVGATRPYLPDSLNDRQQDNWEPLFAIAELAGTAWLEAVKEAALEVSEAEESSESSGVRLLSDTKATFEKCGSDKMGTTHLIEALCEDQERPWSSWNHGKTITPRQVASLFRGFGIFSKTVRIGAMTIKGYESLQFNDSWTRYLPSVTPSQSATEANPRVTDTSFCDIAETAKVTCRTATEAICDAVTDPESIALEESEEVIDLEGEEVEIIE